MDIMEYLFLEMPTILLSKRDINATHDMAEADKINASIAESEDNLLTWCSLENLMDAKKYYEGAILKGIKTSLFGITTNELLDYTDILISMKKERER